ncbi:cytochrome P450 [Nocardiopsis gilva YIM 90087]|uniref:Cytochrome P450 n=1 Tax=Nocardiopsis gilva YIM 90087 TaxID=1235441 RepID=A0A223S4L4_9ACTN|nr:cytochrome P450 [Nocardiopsis gilva]ASU83048.1 cytochrome P450 [Nocardiopsis gilva YIM 90087]
MTTPADHTATHEPDVVEFFTDPEFVRDPYGAWARVREQGPVVKGRFVDGSTIWFITRHEEVRSVLNDPRFANNSTSVPGVEENERVAIMRHFGIPEEYIPYIADSILDSDGADHTRLRKLVSRAFTVRRVNELRPRVEEITDRLLDELPDTAENGVVDLIEHFTYPLPITVISEMVGVPEEDRPLWRKWSHGLISMEPEAMGNAMRDMVDHINQMIEQRRSAPSDDLIDAMIQVQDEDGTKLSDVELATMILTLVIAGHETTAHLLGNGTVALLTHPDQLELLREDESRLPAAVHELMRWCGPVLATRPRFATEDVMVGETLIRQGERVQAMLVAANHDPRYFDSPERLDITRRPVTRGEQHVGFSHGAHYCLGAALARQEGEVAFGKLFRRYPELSLAVPEDELEWEQSPGMRRLARLPVRL